MIDAMLLCYFTVVFGFFAINFGVISNRLVHALWCWRFRFRFRLPVLLNIVAGWWCSFKG